MIRIDQNELRGLGGSILLLRRVWRQPAIGQTTIPHDDHMKCHYFDTSDTERFDLIRFDEK